MSSEPANVLYCDRRAQTDNRRPPRPPLRPQRATQRLPPRRVLLIGGGIPILALGLWSGAPTVERALNTVSTDDAYVSDYVTFVAPRVSGQVVRVLVEDNNRVHKGDVLMELDREPYQVQVDIAEAAVAAAKADLVAATAATRGHRGKNAEPALRSSTYHRTGR